MLAVNRKKSAVKPKKPKKINFLWETIKQTWMEFANSSSIHGVKYVVDRNGTVVTKIMWIVIVTISFLTANVLVSTFWSRYKSNPTRMNVETNHAPINELPFPAVTLCSTNLISYTKAIDLVKTLELPENVTQSMILHYFEQTIGFGHRIDFDSDSLEKLQEVLVANRYDVSATMEKVRISCRDLLVKCRWESRMIDCTKLFHRSMTYTGYCCSFNLAEYNKNNFKPMKPNKFGIGKGLSVIIQPHIDHNAVSKIYSEGIQLMLHESNTYPGDTSNQKMLPLQAETMISIKPSITWCSNQVKALSISDRECVFPDEYNLKFFSQYREPNCEVECRMFKTMDKCDCLPYFYPNYINYPVCNFSRIECLVNHYFELHETKTQVNSSCACPASCNGIFYDITTDIVPLVVGNISVDNFYKGVNSSHLAIHVFMDAQVYKRMRRDLLTNIIGLVSNFGGVYSLFLGLSVIGLFEFFYNLIVRLYKNYRTMKRVGKQKSVVKKLSAVNEFSRNRKTNMIVYDTSGKMMDDSISGGGGDGRLDDDVLEDMAPSYNEIMTLNPYNHHKKLFKREIVNHM